jgi:hypothetical protein
LKSYAFEREEEDGNYPELSTSKELAMYIFFKK